jgi:hypothetical protein
MSDSQVTTGFSEKVSIKRVYFTGTDLLAVGYALCYDAATNFSWAQKSGALNAFGVASYPSSLHDTSAGSTALAGTDLVSASDQNVTRVINVIKPTTATLNFFAGVVKDSPQGSLLGPCWVNIYVPTANGQGVPVFTSANCTIDVTGLTVVNGSYAMAAVTGSQVALATALATWDRSTTNGQIFARLGGAIATAGATTSSGIAAVVTITTTAPLAIPLSSRVVQYLDTTTVAGALTLADGFEGQTLSIQIVVPSGTGGSVTITPADPGNFATLIAPVNAKTEFSITFRSGKWWLEGAATSSSTYAVLLS